MEKQLIQEIIQVLESADNLLDEIGYARKHQKRQEIIKLLNKLVWDRDFERGFK